ncbi:MAG TPA: DUF1996 domain-containing protein [bacterium]|nr:DUF1996 domain-containing protein [bacterium]
MGRIVRYLLLGTVFIIAGCGGGGLVTRPPGEPAEFSGWFAYCSPSHTLPDDPIVFPRQPGASHLHDFFGNQTTNAHSTLSTMLAGRTLCTAAADTAAYWVPVLYRNGTRVDSDLVVAAYTRSPTLRASTQYRAPSPDLKVVIGNANATRPEDNPLLGTRIYWVCFDGGDPRREPPASCTPTDSIFLVIEYPECWNGALDSADHRSHLAYPTGDVCPGTHPTAIPRLFTAYLYPVGTPTGAITLASGNVYSAHGDFWNTWNQARFEQLTASCVNAGVDCGFQQDNTTSISRRLDVGRIRRLIGGTRRGY